MAQRKKPTFFTSRDPEFAAKLGDQIDLSKLIEDELPAPAEAPVVQEDTRIASEPSPPPENTPHQMAVNAVQLPKQKSSVRKPLKTEQAAFRMTFYWPADLVHRAAIWAEKARCPVGTILTRAWDASKEEIVRRIENGVKYKDIPHDLVATGGVRISIRVRLNQSSAERLSAELDPEGITGISGHLSRWIRKEVTPMVDVYLRNAGY